MTTFRETETTRGRQGVLIFIRTEHKNPGWTVVPDRGLSASASQIVSSILLGKGLFAFLAQGGKDNGGHG